MSDRELLEMAAKSVGLEQYHLFVRSRFFVKRQDSEHAREWNPLENDSDALRLAIDLGLCVMPFPNDKDVIVGMPKAGNLMQPYGSDKYQAARRSIVIAAAEIGRKMELASTNTTPPA